MTFRPSHRAFAFAGALLAGSALFFLATRFSAAQEDQFEREITARSRLFPQIGPGIKAMRHGPGNRYYFLSSVDHAVRIYSADGTYLGQVPPDDKGKSQIQYGEGFDVDAAGRIYVADRGANAVRAYSPAGKLLFSVPVTAPISIAVLPSGEIAVTSLNSRELVTVLDSTGKDIREFGDLSDLADHPQLNHLLNIGRLADDPENHIYYAFTYRPEPTVRKYDRFGYSSYQISLHTLDIYPSAQAARRDIARLDQQDAPAALPHTITAIGVDPATQEVWIALGDELMKFDKNGNRVEEYRTLQPNGEDLSAVAILVEPHRLLLADDPHGIFEFARPDQAVPIPTKAK